MRIHRLIDLLEEAIENADFAFKSEPGNMSSFLHVEKVKRFIDLLDETGLFPTELAALKKSNLHLASMGVLKFPNTEATGWSNELNQLKVKADMTLATLRAVAGDNGDASNHIYLRIPAQQDFGELAKLAGKLQTIFGQLVYEEPIQGKLDIEARRTGRSGSMLVWVRRRRCGWLPIW